MSASDMISLFIEVLTERQKKVKPLEKVFWSRSLFELAKQKTPEDLSVRDGKNYWLSYEIVIYDEI